MWVNYTIAIEGWGLTAFDVISELSIGRGGRFIRSKKGSLTYIKSANEPKIHIFSRSGIPLSARAINQKDVSGQYKPRFFTYEYIDAMRLKHAKLSLEQDILPALVHEIEYVYYQTYFRYKKIKFDSRKFDSRKFDSRKFDSRKFDSRKFDSRKFDSRKFDSRKFDVAFENWLDNDTIKLSILELVPLEDRFSLETLVNPVPLEALSNQEKYEEWLHHYIQLDIAEAYNGNVDSPMKAATDVLRDIRDILRYAIDFRGLTEESHRKLYGKFIPVMNRLAVGPPKERLEEVVALKEAGIIVAYHLPGTKALLKGDDLFLTAGDNERFSSKIDFLLCSRISTHSPSEDASLLIQNLIKNGTIKLYYNGGFHPGGIEITKTFNVIEQHGESIPNLYALGMLVEGIKFYTFIVPRPGVNSTAISDAGTAVMDMLNKIRAKALL